MVNQKCSNSSRQVIPIWPLTKFPCQGNQMLLEHWGEKDQKKNQKKPRVEMEDKDTKT